MSAMDGAHFATADDGDEEEESSHAARGLMLRSQWLSWHLQDVGSNISLVSCSLLDSATAWVYRFVRCDFEGFKLKEASKSFLSSGIGDSRTTHIFVESVT